MRKNVIGIAVAGLLVTACTNSNGLNKPTESWKNFKEPTEVTATQLKDNESLVVFYRENDIQGSAVNVYVNGHYQASLLPNTISPVAVCADRNVFSSSFYTTEKFGNRTTGSSFNLPSKETTYIKVAQDAKGQLTFVKVNNDVAKNAIVNLPIGNQTFSRVTGNLNCQSVLANETLAANALFAFNKSGYNNILPAGRKSINEFAQRLPALGTVTKLVISGHTDPSGSDKYNQALSQKRANTVKTALQKAGVTAPIEAVGYGKTQPVVTHCDNLKGKEKQECNQPNRRVEITVYGNK